ncbi:hypothetical protein BC941DRAFT_452218 [Chlamydoabsidia padenii]|nr:hypothetical protein BC941DRAFT_452218 [Chlamydoabsidia padenii]
MANHFLRQDLYMEKLSHKLTHASSLAVTMKNMVADYFEHCFRHQEITKKLACMTRWPYEQLQGTTSTRTVYIGKNQAAKFGPFTADFMKAARAKIEKTKNAGSNAHVLEQF